MNSYEKVVAHRGIFDNKKIIENTLPAFQEAIRLNYPFELDVQLTKDNKIVVFHDDTLKRLCDDKKYQNKEIQNLPYSTLKDIPLLDSHDHIPLFSEVLKLNNDSVFIDIEVKHTLRIKETINILMKELEPYHNYSIKSFDPMIVRYVKKHYPDVNVGLLIDNKYNNFVFNKLLHSKFILKYSLCDFVSISKKLLKNSDFMKIISAYPVSIWTASKKDDIDFSDKYTYICNNLPYKK